VRLRESFEFRNHLCIVFELLSINIYELIAENNVRTQLSTLVDGENDVYDA
jgi:dual specificity protein kinase YAK1